MRITIKTTATIFTLLLLISNSIQMFACSCLGQRTIQEEVKYSDAVVVGTIISNQIVTLIDSTILKMFSSDTLMQNSNFYKMPIARYELLVLEVYKGKITNDTLLIFTGLGSGDCGIEFEIGKKYIVYGKNETYFGQTNNDYKFPKAKNTFWTHICMRTNLFYEEEIIEIEKFTKKIRRGPDENESLFISNPDIPPIYKNGGINGLNKFIQDNLNFPKTGECVSGIVFVGFTVDTL